MSVMEAQTTTSVEGGDPECLSLRWRWPVSPRDDIAAYRYWPETDDHYFAKDIVLIATSDYDDASRVRHVEQTRPTSWDAESELDEDEEHGGSFAPRAPRKRIHSMGVKLCSKSLKRHTPPPLPGYALDVGDESDD